MSDPIKDRLAQRIAARRAQEAARTDAAATPAAPAPSTPAASPLPTASPVAGAAPAPRFGFTDSQIAAIAAAKAAIASGENAMLLARRLAPLVADGITRSVLADALVKSKPWVSKVLSLLTASPDIQRMIESGQLAPNEYYDNRLIVETSVKGRSDPSRTQRMSRVSIYSSAARDIAMLLQHLAKQHGAAPIRVDSAMSLRDLTNILNLRGSEIWQLVNRK
jgi:hypothetical protein